MQYTEQTLRERIERDFWVGPSTKTWKAVTGECYVTIGSPMSGVPTIPGTIDEGCVGVLAFDQETAWHAALTCFENYAFQRGKNLYWRQPPQFEWDQARKGCRFYIRVLVSKIRSRKEVDVATNEYHRTVGAL